MAKRRVKAILTQPQVGETVTVEGWVKTARHAKNVTFLALNDGSCFRDLQLVVEPTVPHFETEIRKIGTGFAISATGVVTESLGSEQAVELRVSDLRILGSVDPDYPLQKKRHSFEFLRTIAHLRPRTNTFGAVFRVRNAAAYSIHRFFQERGFIYLHTPIITASDCEGAGAMFRVTVLDAKNPPRTPEGEVDFSQDFFGKEARLTVSGQLEAEIVALALGRVYTFGPTFRAENSNTTRHLAEFWMVEPEMAFCDLAGDMELAESFLKQLIRDVLESVPDDMAFFRDRIDATILDTLSHVLESPFERMTYTEAIAALQKSGENFIYPPEWGKDIQSEHERWLTETYLKRPVIVTDYPKTIKPFYMYVNDDEKTVRAMDILVPKVGEIIGGSQREDRVEVLRARIREMGLREEDYGWYVDLRRYGGAPHAGFGLGFERAIQFLTGMGNIRDVIPFPRVPGYAEF